MLITTINRELTKKPKIKGLSFFSWVIVGIITFISWFLVLFYAIPIAIVLFCGFYLLEYFDEDIYEIIIKNQSIKSTKYYS